MSQQDKLVALCKDLRLPSIRKMIQDPSTFEKPAQAYEILFKVLYQEKQDRLVRAKQNRIRAANFPQKKLLDELEEGALPEVAQHKLPELKTLSFIEKGQNVILTGPPGTGKTH
ncbi:ATP-binding protein, partial [Oceanobacillus indicireducens]|uniref:ATP-binding protein n=1 Tax=Oceanobacillus indicireducens TaxID=1004261 RepID=UPI001668AA61